MLRFQIKNITRANFLFSYATQGQDNAIIVFVSPTGRSGVGIYVNNVRTKAKLGLQEDVWYGVCLSWAAAAGDVVIFVDGEMAVKKTKKVRQRRCYLSLEIILNSLQFYFFSSSLQFSLPLSSISVRTVRGHTGTHAPAL